MVTREEVDAVSTKSSGEIEICLEQLRLEQRGLITPTGRYPKLGSAKQQRWAIIDSHLTYLSSVLAQRGE